MFLSVALERKEYENFRFWVLAQQDPKKFKWSKSRNIDITNKVVEFAHQMGAQPTKGDVWDYAQARGLDRIYEIETEDGKVYVDQRGNPVDAPKGMIFIPTKNPEAKKAKWGITI